MPLRMSDETVTDQTMIMVPIDDNTVVLEPVAEAIREPDPPQLSRLQLRLLPIQNEIAIYDCGTVSPGLVHDPCQHSSTQVLCCQCAGCMFDLWACERSTEPDSYFWWEAQKLGMRFDPWVRHPYALILYALFVIFLFASHIVQELLWILGVVAALMFMVVAVGFQQVF